MKKGSNRRQTEGQTWKQKKYGNTFKEPCECVCHCNKECKADTVKQLKIFKKKPEDPNSSIIFGTLIWLHPKPTESQFLEVRSSHQYFAELPKRFQNTTKVENHLLKP